MKLIIEADSVTAVMVHDGGPSPSSLLDGQGASNGSIASVSSSTTTAPDEAALREVLSPLVEVLREYAGIADEGIEMWIDSRSDAFIGLNLGGNRSYRHVYAAVLTLLRDCGPAAGYLSENPDDPTLLAGPFRFSVSNHIYYAEGLEREHRLWCRYRVPFDIAAARRQVSAIVEHLKNPLKRADLSEEEMRRLRGR